MAATKFEIAEYFGEFPTSSRECKPASRAQAMQANDDEVTGEYLPKWHPRNGRPQFLRVTPSAVRERNLRPNLSDAGR